MEEQEAAERARREGRRSGKANSGSRERPTTRPRDKYVRTRGGEDFRHVRQSTILLKTATTNWIVIF